MTSRACVGCRKFVLDGRLYFGILGPFCAVGCRDAWLERQDDTPTNQRARAALGRLRSASAEVDVEDALDWVSEKEGR